MPSEIEAGLEILNMPLPAGEYAFYFATDKTADDTPRPDWLDAVGVTVEF